MATGWQVDREATRRARRDLLIDVFVWHTEDGSSWEVTTREDNLGRGPNELQAIIEAGLNCLSRGQPTMTNRFPRQSPP